MIKRMIKGHPITNRVATRVAVSLQPGHDWLARRGGRMQLGRYLGSHFLRAADVRVARVRWAMQAATAKDNHSSQPGRLVAGASRCCASGPVGQDIARALAQDALFPRPLWVGSPDLDS